MTKHISRSRSKSSNSSNVDLRRGIEQKAWKRNLPSLLASGGGAKLVVVEIDQLNGPVLRLHTVQNWLHNRTLGNGIT
ncbi:hypothetical protein T4B_6825 [Trichinella pseudospiralis]|uniref:Uncharacterized protein n=1 Tax=Trichinella pseudospiralis TaxID=6337 RepID=A0A0V1K559_TRIPS|nr:hypothetical protein T4B_6825 [Trichinella pseudospiralis]KRZ42356.1 hypothetical protein T4C_6510 [Trichinella pseudospiralis]